MFPTNLMGNMTWPHTFNNKLSALRIDNSYSAGEVGASVVRGNIVELVQQKRHISRIIFSRTCPPGGKNSLGTT
jgi:hypothetical protein